MRIRKKEKDKIARQFSVIIVLVLVMLLMMTGYLFHSFYISTVKNIDELGISNMKSESAMIENYLNRGMDVLWVTADTVNNMLENGASSEEILQYLTAEAEHEKQQIDENFTGIYGYINGEYLDGIGWEPPEGYVPTEREWYVAAREADGKPTIVAPYLDAQTGTIMISVSQLLADGESVVSLDIALNEVQTITENMTLNGMGYGFIMDSTGLVIAHFDEKEKGKVYPLNEEQSRMVSEIYSQRQESFETEISGEKCTVFSEQVLNDWYVVMVVSNTRLFSELRSHMIVSAFVCIFVFLAIVLLCLTAYRRILEYQRKERESRDKIDELNSNMVRALAYTIDAKDRYTSGHSQRVAEYSLAIAKRMGKSEEEQNVIYFAGLLHDVGKIRVAEEVINKPGKLTDEEFDQIRVHPVSGYHILKDIFEEGTIAFGAKYHHERYDGNGYPNGLAGENIPEVARIIGVADAYDAMTSNRSYRNALPQKTVRSEIERGRGRQFDEKIADIMLQMIDEDKEYKMCQSREETKNILVVDDETKNIEEIEDIFKDMVNYRIIGATTGEEALEILNKQPIHLILLDLLMPDRNGFELYPLIREQYHIPVVLMTEDKRIETIRQISKLGVEDCVTKPFRASIVKETVHGTINGWD